MSRKNKIGIDYFTHDVDMVNDKKVRLLIAKHGINGYALFNRLLEEIYRDSGYYLKIDEDFKILFCSDCKVETEVFDSVLLDMLERKLFDKKLFDDFGILTSRRIQENYCSATERRKEVSFISDYLLFDVISFYNPDKVNVNINKLNADINVLNDNKNTQSKVKEKESKEKINNNVVIKPESVSDQIWNDWIKHRKNRKAIITNNVIKTFSDQAEKAGYTLESAIRESIDRGWTGFKAEWVNKNKFENTDGSEAARLKLEKTRKLLEENGQ